MVYESKAEALYVVGDVHGEFDAFAAFLKRYRFEDTDFIIAGDCGFGFSSLDFEKKTMIRNVNRYCLDHNCNVYMIRGNHDDPKRFDGKQINLTHIHAIPDYSLIVYNKGIGTVKNILCIGGAISIDRMNRMVGMRKRAEQYVRYHAGCSLLEAENKLNRSWWEDEPPVFKPELIDAVTDYYRITTVVSHNCPGFANPSMTDISAFLKADPTLKADIDTEQETFTKIFNYIKEKGQPLDCWYYGHHHLHKTAEIHKTIFTCLDMVRNGKPDAVEIV